MIRNSLHKTFALGSTAIVALASVPALAQDTTPSSTGLAQPAAPGATPAEPTPTGVQEIVVTAQRRSENVQRSSLAIQVLGGETLQRAGVTQAGDLNRLVPGLQIAAVGSTVQIFVRGVGDITTNPLTSPAVAFNVDGVYIGSPSAIGTNFYDVARIEVLKGPQGTLYGRNASGGAVNLITNAPKIGVAEGYIEGEYGNYSDGRVAGAVNAPLGDDFAVRGAFQIIHRDGYLTDGSSDQKDQEVRLRGLYKPAGSPVSVQLNFDAAHVGGQGQGFVLLPLVNRKNPWTSINGPAANTVLTTYPFLPFPTDQASGRDYQHNRFINASAQIDWDFGPATLTIIPSYRHTRENFQTFAGFLYRQFNIGNQKSIEARLANASDRLKWVLGGYYYDQDQRIDAAAATSTLFQNIALNYKVGDKSYAGFGEATYSLTDRLRAIGGVRYTHEKTTLVGATSDESPLTGPRVAEVYGPGDQKDSAVSWKGGAEFDLAPHSMLFATASRGFKAGGLNPSAAPNAFKPEQLTAYELGLRNRFLDNRLQVNLEGFYWDYRNKQESSVGLTPAGNFTNLTRNAGKARLKGGSVDIVYQPTSADTLRFYAEYNDAKYKSFIVNVPAFLFNPTGISTGCAIGAGAPGFVRLDCSRFQLVRAPKWTGSAGYDHRFDLAGGATLTASVDGQYSSSYYLSTNFTPLEHASKYATVDASLTYVTASKRISITGFVKNISDHAVYTGGNQLPLQAPLFAANINAPRTYGGRVRFSF